MTHEELRGRKCLSVIFLHSGGLTNAFCESNRQIKRKVRVHRASLLQIVLMDFLFSLRFSGFIV